MASHPDRDTDRGRSSNVPASWRPSDTNGPGQRTYQGSHGVFQQEQGQGQLPPHHHQQQQQQEAPQQLSHQDAPHYPYRLHPSCPQPYAYLPTTPPPISTHQDPHLDPQTTSSSQKHQHHHQYIPYHPPWGRPHGPSSPSQGRGSQWPPQPWYDHGYDHRLEMRYPYDADYGWEEPYLGPSYPPHPRMYPPPSKVSLDKRHYDRLPYPYDPLYLQYYPTRGGQKTRVYEGSEAHARQTRKEPSCHDDPSGDCQKQQQQQQQEQDSLRQGKTRPGDLLTSELELGKYQANHDPTESSRPIWLTSQKQQQQQQQPLDQTLQYQQSRKQPPHSGRGPFPWLAPHRAQQQFPLHPEYWKGRPPSQPHTMEQVRLPNLERLRSGPGLEPGPGEARSLEPSTRDLSPLDWSEDTTQARGDRSGLPDTQVSERTPGKHRAPGDDQGPRKRKISFEVHPSSRSSASPDFRRESFSQRTSRRRSLRRSSETATPDVTTRGRNRSMHGNQVGDAPMPALHSSVASSAETIAASLSRPDVAMMPGTEATEGGSTAPVSLLTGLQSLNERSSSHSRAKPPSSTPERPTLSRINKRPSGIGEEGYYLQQDLDALYDKWITEYDRNKRVQIRKSRMLDGTRGDRHRISKHRYKRLHRRRAKGKRTTRGQGEDEEFSSGDEQSYSDEDAAGDSGSLTGDSEEDDDGELYDVDSDNERGRSRERRLWRRRSHSGRRRSHSKRIQSHSGRRRSHSGRRRSHSGRRRSHSGRIRSHSGRIRSHSGRIRSHSGRIRSHSERIRSHSERIRSHSGTRGYRQYSRDKSSMSSSKKQIERDQATKQEGKRHQCKACGKRFSRPSQLHTHSLTHSGEKPHICSVCSKNFNVASNLKRHMKTHEASRTVTNSADAAFRGHLVSFSLNTVANLGLGITSSASTGTIGPNSSVLPVPTLSDATPMQERDQAVLQQEPALPIEAHPIQEQLAILEQQHLLQLQQQHLQEGEEQAVQSPSEQENQPPLAPPDEFISSAEVTPETPIVETLWIPPSQLAHTLWTPGNNTIPSSEILTLSGVPSVFPEDESDPVQGAHTSTSTPEKHKLKKNLDSSSTICRP